MRADVANINMDSHEFVIISLVVSFAWFALISHDLSISMGQLCWYRRQVFQLSELNTRFHMVMGIVAHLHVLLKRRQLQC